MPPEELPEPLKSNGEETPSQHILLDFMTAVGQAVCLQNDVAPELAVTRTYVADLMAGDEASPLLSGWRNEVVGGLMAEFAAGRASLTARVDEAGLRVEPN